MQSVIRFIKDYLRQMAILGLSIFTIITAYGALTNVNPGDTLSSSSWNDMVTKLTTLNTSATDLVTKSYVDSAVSAAGGVTWAGYTTSTYALSSGYKTLNQACISQYPGSHWASTSEIIKLGSNYPWTNNVWTIDNNMITLTQYANPGGGYGGGIIYGNLGPTTTIPYAGTNGNYLDTSGNYGITTYSNGLKLACVY